MKNYCFDRDDKELFIKRFIEKKDNITIIYGNNDRFVVPNTIENKNGLLLIMRNQVATARDKIEILKENFVEHIIYIVGYGLVAITAIFFIPEYPIIASMGSIPATVTIVNIFKAINVKKKLKDYDKNIFYMDNETIFLNQKVIDLEKRKEISQLKDQKNKITINDVDKYTLEELKKLKYDIEERQEIENIKKLVRTLKM